MWLQMVQNAPKCHQVVFNQPKHADITLLMSACFCPYSAHIKFKSLAVTYRVLAGPAPSYLICLVQVHATPCPLHSTCGRCLFPNGGTTSRALSEQGMYLSRSQLHGSLIVSLTLRTKASAKWLECKCKCKWKCSWNTEWRCMCELVRRYVRMNGKELPVSLCFHCVVGKQQVLSWAVWAVDWMRES